MPNGDAAVPKTVVRVSAPFPLPHKDGCLLEDQRTLWWGWGWSRSRCGWWGGDHYETAEALCTRSTRRTVMILEVYFAHRSVVQCASPAGRQIKPAAFGGVSAPCNGGSDGCVCSKQVSSPQRYSSITLSRADCVNCGASCCCKERSNWKYGHG